MGTHHGEGDRLGVVATVNGEDPFGIDQVLDGLPPAIRSKDGGFYMTCSRICACDIKKYLRIKGSTSSFLLPDR